MVATTDLTDTTATTARDLLMSPLSLVPTPMLMLIPGMATMDMEDTEVTMVATTDLTLMATTARDLLMSPLSLVPTPRPTLTPGMATMDMDTDLMDMATMATVLTVTLTGDKK